jgi:hypothetical protein
MAQAGVPAFSVAAGMKIKGKPKDFASKAFKDFNDKAYHSPQDEFKPEWDFLGLRCVGPVHPGPGRRRRQRRPIADLESRGRVPPGAREERSEVD